MAKDKESSREEDLENLIQIPSIGRLTARVLLESGYDSISKLKSANIEDLKSIPHIGEKKAEKIIKGAQEEKAEESEESITHELKCPTCDNTVGVDMDECPECDNKLEIRGGVILPEHGLVEDPKKTLAEVEEKLWDGNEDAEAWYMRGAIVESMGAHREALKSYDRVIELDPFFNHIWNSKAKASLKVGKNKEASKAYKLAFDIQGLPENIKHRIERESVTSAQEINELEERDETERKAHEKISQAREKLEDIDKSGLDLSSLTTLLDKATENRLEGNNEGALEKALEVIQKSEMISTMNQNISDVKDSLEGIEYDEVKEKVDEDIEKINELAQEENYSTAEKLAKELPYALEFEKKKQEKREFLLGELQDKITKVEDFIEDLSEDVRDIIGVDQTISEAEEALDKNNLKEASSLISNLLENEDELSKISEMIDQIETMSMGLEGIDPQEDEFLGELDEGYEEGKEYCREGNYEKAEKVFSSVLEKLEKRIDETVKTREEEISEIKEGIEEQIAKAREQDLDFEEFKEDFEEIKRELEDGEVEEEEALDRLEKLQERGEYLKEFRSVVSEVQEKIDDYESFIEMEEYREELTKLEASFEEGDFEESIEKTEDLKEKLVKEIESKKEESILEEDVEEKLNRAREKLADLRKVDFDISAVKQMLKRSVQAKKKGELQKSLEMSEKMLETAEDILDLSELREELEGKIEELKEKDLTDEDRCVKEIELYMELTNIGEIELTRNYLDRLGKDLDEALDEEKSYPPSPEKDEEIINEAKHIKEKVKNVKEFKNLIEKSGMEIKFDKEYLKNAIVKIKDMEYKEAGEILTQGKNNLLEQLNEKIEARLESMDSQIKELDDKGSINRAKGMRVESQNRWKLKDYEEALSLLAELSEFIKSISDKDDILEKRLYNLLEIKEDIEGIIDTEEIEDLLEKSREKDLDKDKERRRVKDIFIDIRDILEEELSEILDEDLKNIDEILEKIPDQKKALVVGNIAKAKKSLETDNLERTALHLREYKKILDEELKSESE